jgi:phage major head subunit gpT-like protein
MSLVVNYELLNSYRVTLSRKFDDAFAAAPASEWQGVATLIESGSERNEYPFLGEVDSMRKWVGPRVVRQLKQFKYSIVNEDYELTMAIKRNHLEDDAGSQLPQYGSWSQIMARSAARHPDELVMQQALAKVDSIVCYDGQNAADTDHPVGPEGAQVSVSNISAVGATPAWYLLDTSRPIKPLIYQLRRGAQFQAMFDLSSERVFYEREFVFGTDVRDAVGVGLWQTLYKSTQPLTEANYLAAKNAMIAFKNDEGVKMGIRPDLLVVPTELDDVATKLFTQDRLASGESNYLKGSIKLLVSRYL